MTLKTGAQIEAGQTLYNAIDHGRIGTVESVRPYVGPLLSQLGEGTQIARFYDGKEMTLPAVSAYAV
jgi:hypothetical protein